MYIFIFHFWIIFILTFTNTIHFYIILKPSGVSGLSSTCLNIIHFYIILKPLAMLYTCLTRFEYHTFLHHSQTLEAANETYKSLNTIHFYIILKREAYPRRKTISLNTIHFYIILKHYNKLESNRIRLNTIHFYIILKP